MRLDDLMTIYRTFGQRNGFNLVSNAVVIAKSGSHLYNLHTPDSDVDYVAVVWPPEKDIIGIGNWESWHPAKDGLPASTSGVDLDVKVYSVKRFVQLLMKANPAMLEVLWGPEEALYRTTPAFQELQAHRHLFTSKKIVDGLVGFAQNQLQRMVTVDGTRDLGAKRKQYIEQFGYDPKNAHHVIRLLRMAAEFVLSGGEQFTVARTIDRDELISIKQGKWKLPDIRHEANTLLTVIRNLGTDGLPDGPDEKQVNELLVSLTRTRLKV